MFREIYVLYKREVKKTVRNPAVITIMIIQPLMWIAFFGSSFANTPHEFLQTFFHTSNYIAFLLPGELATSMLFIGLFSSMSMINDKRFGYLKKLMVTKADKSAIFFGKVFGATTRGVIQIPVMILAAMAFGVTIPGNVIGIVEWIIGLLLLGVGFSALYLIVTMNSRDWQTPNVIANFINLPLMFSSTALFPSSFFPVWMRDIAEVNPISFAADLGRAITVYGDPDPIYLAYLAIFAFVMVTIGVVIAKTRLSPE
ncbi:ABC transporter [Sulfolobales archaeon HS-7]|nr:ABC transporter [Sulfolobales archaeon HS-7]